ncbi:MAG: PAC2 family protein [Candidatus Omnitrophica bacterium]|nr:PAC2 family protein [Candidatus Omnitrophota bacterium]MDD5351674.1 PAC2 family protein [Candidatus Omnitrophota bacterium]MDD5550884.1 PAC2 family protein [Candidatus Omnitrophota bacterium]
MKKNITLLKKPKLKNTFFIAAWPGMGDVALKAATFLKDKLKAEEFAVFKSEDFFQPQGVEIQNQIITTAKIPEGKFYFYKSKLLKNDLIIFISEAQPLLEKSYEYAKQIISFIKEFDVEMVFTFAALPSPIEHNKKPGVWAVATHKELLEKLKQLPLQFMPTGQISGLNGLILGVSGEFNIPGICLLGEIPFYTIQIENPLSSLAVLRVLTKIINVRIEYAELEEHAHLISQEIEKFMDFLKDPESQEKPIGSDEIEKIKESLSAYTKIPESVKKKIEQLFEEARRDISQASELKKELDHWSIYKEYEDRFLDLFRKPGKKNN